LTTAARRTAKGKVRGRTTPRRWTRVRRRVWYGMTRQCPSVGARPDGRGAAGDRGGTGANGKEGRRGRGKSKLSPSGLAVGPRALRQGPVPPVVGLLARLPTESLARRPPRAIGRRRGKGAVEPRNFLVVVEGPAKTKGVQNHVLESFLFARARVPDWGGVSGVGLRPCSHTDGRACVCFFQRGGEEEVERGGGHGCFSRCVEGFGRLRRGW
jgi:hypothetical protein